VQKTPKSATRRPRPLRAARRRAPLGISLTTSPSAGITFLGRFELPPPSPPASQDAKAAAELRFTSRRAGRSGRRTHPDGEDPLSIGRYPRLSFPLPIDVVRWESVLV